MTAGTIVTLLSAATPAQAEGSWTSYMKGVRHGFDSRTWSDHNRDTTSTRIKLTGVSGGSFCLQLTRETRWYQPDENRGIRNFQSAATNYWGRQPAGSYHFTDVSETCGGNGGVIGAGQTHNAKYVGVWY